MRSKRWFIGSDHLGGYMHRWLVRTPWFTLRLHHILRSDEGRDFHDHPWDFTSLVLRGGYLEHRPGCRGMGCCAVHSGCGGPCRYYGPGSIIRRRATDLHRIELVNGPAWTLVLTSQYKRGWGFQTPTGWVPYREYHRSLYLVKP